VQPGTVHILTFSGDPEACIPAGAQVVSDPIDFGRLPPASAVSISLFILKGNPPGSLITLHNGSRTTSWFTAGNHVSDTSLSGAGVGQAERWQVSHSS
jgi:hypothetical protein